MFCSQCQRFCQASVYRSFQWRFFVPKNHFSAYAPISPNKSVGDGEETCDLDELFRQITIELKGHEKAVMSSYRKFVSMVADELDVNVGRIVVPPKPVINRYPLLKSVFVHAKHYRQYELRTYYSTLELKHITGSTADTFLEYIQRNLPEGMCMKVTKQRLDRIPEHLLPQPSQIQAASVSPSQDTVTNQTMQVMTSNESTADTVSCL